MAEVDFPRGKPIKQEGPKTSVASNKKGITSHKSKPNQKGKKNGKGKQTNQNNPQPQQSNKFIASKFLLTPEAFHKDVLVLGCVNELRKDEVVVELPNNSKGVLTTQGLNVAPGQVMAVGVEGREGGEGGRLRLSVGGETLNRGLTRADLRQGMYISGTVTSVEDRGYIVNTDIAGTTSFIAGKDTQSKLVAGQSVFCVITSISESGQVFLTPQNNEEATFTEVKNWKSVAMVHVRPGNAVKAQVVRKFPTGLSVRIYNQPASSSALSVFIPVAHLHKPLEYYNINFKVNGRVIFVDYRERTVLVTTLPHLVNARSANTLVDQFENLRGLVFPILPPSTSRPICELPTFPPTSAIVVSSKSPEEVTDVDKSNDESKRPIDVKVVGVSYYMGALEVSSDADVVENASATLRVSDLHPGMLITGSVSQVEKTGLDIKIAPLITAKCGVQHLSDASSMLKPETMFSVDQAVQCRVLYIDEEEMVHVTHKPTLVNSALRVISSYHHAIPGAVAHGWVTKVTKSEVTVSFYDNVTGFVPSSDIEGSPADSYHVGEAVTCQVVECTEAVNAKDSPKLLLTFDVQLARPVPNTPAITKIRNAFTSAVIGDRVSGIVSHADVNALTLILDTGVTAILPTQHLSDHHAICSLLLTRYNVGSQMSDLIVLNKDSSNMRLVLTNKASLRDLPVKYEDIKVGSVIPGHIKQISDSSYTVGFLGTWKAVATRTSGMSYLLGQSVRGLVTEVLGNGVLSVDLEDKATKTNGVTLLQEYFKAIDGVWSRSKFSKTYQVGKVVSGKVVEHRGGNEVAVLLDNNVIGIAQEPITEYHLGKTVKAVVIDVDYANALLHLSFKQDLVSNIVSADKIPVGQELVANILLLKNAYLVASVAPASGTRAIAYIPLSDYNTQGHGKEHFVNLLPGITVHAVLDSNNDEATKHRPLLSLVGGSIPSLITIKAEKKEDDEEEAKPETKAESEGEEDEEDDDEDAAMLDPSAASAQAILMSQLQDDDEGGLSFFKVAEDSDEESGDDPDQDSLSEYMKRVAKAKGIADAAAARKLKNDNNNNNINNVNNTNTDNGQHDNTRSNGSSHRGKPESKKNVSKGPTVAKVTKRKPEAKEVPNKKMRLKK